MHSTSANLDSILGAEVLNCLPPFARKSGRVSSLGRRTEALLGMSVFRKMVLVQFGKLLVPHTDGILRIVIPTITYLFILTDTRDDKQQHDP